MRGVWVSGVWCWLGPASYLFIFVAAVSFSCNKKTTSDDSHSEDQKKKIKVLLESFHDPVKDGGNVDYGSKISENTSLHHSPPSIEKQTINVRIVRNL